MHPRVLTLTAATCPARCGSRSCVSLLGIALLYVTLWKYEMAAKNARMQIRRLRRTLLGDDAVRPAGKERGAVMSPGHRRRPRFRCTRAGKYVAGAYIVFVALVLIYVAIMATRLQPHRARARRAASATSRPATASRTQRSRAGGGVAMSELLAIGVSHKTAPVEVRERLALPEARAGEFLRDLRGAADVHEAVAISTCNRTELYLVVGDPVEAESTVLAMLASQAGIRPTELALGDLLAPQLRRGASPVPRRLPGSSR